MAELAFALVIVLALLWLAERGRVRRRLAELEAEIAELGRVRRRLADLEAGPAARATPPAPAAAARAERAAPARAESAAPPPAAVAPPASAAAAPPPADWRNAVEPAPAAAPRWRPAPPPPRPALLPAWLTEFFTGGHLIVRAGVVVLFFGVAFLLRYAAEHSHLPIEARLTGVAVGALVLLGLGWRWRARRRGYALALQGGGVGLLYLTVFAALRLYALLAPGAAFALLAAVAALSAVLAILQESLAFAMLGATGGYLAPVLTADPHGDHVALFSYFALLDLAVVGIAWFRAWRPLNLLAFAFTYGIGTLWGVLRYEPSQLASTEPFVALYFALFVAAAVLFARREAPRLGHYVDGTLVFGTPVVTLGLQAGLVRHLPYALAYSALALSACYLLLAWQLKRRGRATLALLLEAFLALGVAFATLAIPFALEGRWTAASWALEGAAVLWVGVRQGRRLAVAAGLALELLAGLAYLSEFPALLTGPAGPAIANSRYLTALLVSAAAFIGAGALRRAGPGWLEGWRGALRDALLLWGLLWWLGDGLAEIDRYVTGGEAAAASIAFLGASALGASLAGARAGLRLPRLAALVLLPALAACALALAGAPHPGARGGWWAWPLALAAAYAALRRDEALVPPAAQTALHALGLWLATWLASAELAWQVGQAVRESGTWAAAVLGALPAAALYGAARGSRGARWPAGAQPVAYGGVGAAGLGLYLVSWIGYSAAAFDGGARPLPYLPLLNPMDGAEAFAVLALVAALAALPTARLPAELGQLRAPLRLVVALAAFACLNAMLLRTLHHYAAVPYDLEAIAASTLAQTAMTIFWTLLALALMMVASRSGRRTVWIAGAALLTVVIAKLFLVDLSRTGTVLRIVSFLGVGVLMLVIGYVSPLPPRDPEPST
ncbi:MAG TPA: DUF2339 domain-containing protein [Steroidobacteraceae bacterium]|nr:DUF2339 domain-containing protein [Steroidobacteraceae bacterium]